MRQVKTNDTPMVRQGINASRPAKVDVVIESTMMEAYKQQLSSDGHSPCWSACLPHRSLREAKISSAKGAEVFPVFLITGAKSRNFRFLHRAPRRPSSPSMNSSNQDSNQELS